MTSDQGPGSYVGKIRDETRRYIQGLLAENEKLRELKVSLEADKQRLREERLRLQEQALSLREELDRHREERTRLNEQLSTIEDNNRRFSSEYLEIEEQNNVLANLYVASYRLHSTPERPQVLDALQEIIINLIGSEEFVVFQNDPLSGESTVAASFGVDPARASAIDLSSEPFASTLRSGKLWIAEPVKRDIDTPLVCQPLRLGERDVGMIVIFSLLPHKSGLEPLDYQLFDLLASHAAMALYASRLHHDNKATATPV